jgi:protein-arginine deiminase
MINQLVITEKDSSFSIVPKSYGPVKTSADGLTLDLDPNNIQYVFEDQLKTELEAIGHQVYFVDDADLYFKRGGGIHCATNVERAYFSHKKWWKYKPPNAHDI